MDEADSDMACEAGRCGIAGAWRAELLPRKPYEAAYTAHLPVIGLAFDSQVGRHAFGSDRRAGFQARANGLAYVPAGCDVYSQSTHGGEYLKITIERLQGDPWTSARRFSDVIDPLAIDAARQLRRQLLARHGVDELQCESLVQTLQDRTRRVLSGASIPLAARSWMTPRRLRLVDELIEARLDTKVTVQDLADALGLSAGFFCRAFSAAMGQAPHDHIIDRRMSRARGLLLDPELGLSAIAQASGFASHAHMTTTFRTRLGVTPSELRGICGSGAVDAI
jgi:AraC family transcriptional regulator